MEYSFIEEVNFIPKSDLIGHGDSIVLTQFINIKQISPAVLDELQVSSSNSLSLESLVEKAVSIQPTGPTQISGRQKTPVQPINPPKPTQRMDSIIQPPTPFLASPREIRDMIYKYIVIADHPLNLTFQKTKDNDALFRVCRQVHNEATEVYYEQNHFFIPETFFRFGKPLQSVPTAKTLCGLNAARLGMVRRLDVDMPVGNYTFPFFCAGWCENLI